MRKKLENGEYRSAMIMQKDFVLIMQNCLAVSIVYAHHPLTILGNSILFATSPFLHSIIQKIPTL